MAVFWIAVVVWGLASAVYVLAQTQTQPDQVAELLARVEALEKRARFNNHSGPDQ